MEHVTFKHVLCSSVQIYLNKLCKYNIFVHCQPHPGRGFYVNKKLLKYPDNKAHPEP